MAILSVCVQYNVLIIHRESALFLQGRAALSGIYHYRILYSHRMISMVVTTRAC